MYHYSPLNNTDIRTIHHAFLDAFSDYQVNTTLTQREFQIMMMRRGYSPAISFGAFKEPENELVGFILNGIRMWNGKLTAYDTGTGVAPAHRKQGLTNGMFKDLLTVLSENQAEQYLLEVLRDNTTAYELYKKLGFTVIRNFSVYSQKKSAYRSKASEHPIEYAAGFGPNDWKRLQTFWAFTPSWQNSIDSINAVPNEFVYAVVRVDDQIAGYGIIDKNTGDIPQIAVQKEYRRTGIAGSLIAALLNNTQADVLRVVNVDDAYKDMEPFLHNLGFEKTAGQYEMLLPLKHSRRR